MLRIDAAPLALATRFALPWLLLAAGGARGETVPGHPWCGTGETSLAEKVAVHREHERRLERHRAMGIALRAEPEAARVGEIAVLVDHGDLVLQPNRVDLSDRGVQFVLQKKGGYAVAPSAEPVGLDLGERLPLADDDARAVVFPRGFRFPFFGKLRSRMFVHSDGNLTFDAPDAGSTARSLARLLGGPPRIAPLFADFDPSVASGDGGVYVSLSRTHVVVTWFEVPEFGTDNRNTFQVVLQPNGNVTFAHGALDAQEAIVGLGPGGGGGVQLLDYSTGAPSGVIRGAIAERFVATRSVDDLAIAKAFFREFADVQDHLIVFLDFPETLQPGVFAFELTLKNEIRGIGEPIYDASAQAGSRGRLRSFVQMGSLEKYPESPYDPATGTLSTLDVVAHEAGHRWLARLHYVDGNGQVSDALLGRQRAHWSFCLDTQASVMEGNEFRDDGGGAFTSIAATDRYSPLDQYAMGLLPAAAVPPFFLIEGCSRSGESAPQLGVTVTGSRADIGVEQVIAAVGRRLPPAPRAPRTFSTAFVLVGEGGVFPSEESIAKVDAIRAAWEPYFAVATDGRGAVNTGLTTLRRRR
jgi:hypothetical protein